MRKASTSIAILLIFASDKTAFSFDFQRFSDENHQRTGSTSGDIAPTADGFELNSSGKIIKGPTASIKNTIGATSDSEFNPAQVSSDHQPHPNQNENMNTSYSFSAKLGVCGVSTLRPFEIEKLVELSAQNYGVDPAFAKAVAWAESRFDQNRTSPKGARGAMQLMPDTAEELAVSNICDARSNIDGGVRYLKQLIDEFQNPMLAAAAYNAGAQAIYDAGGIPSISETVRYVASVTNYQLGLHAPRRQTLRGLTRRRPKPEEQANDVIGVQRSRFVKGVMQF